MAKIVPMLKQVQIGRSDLCEVMLNLIKINSHDKNVESISQLKPCCLSNFAGLQDKIGLFFVLCWNF